MMRAICFLCIAAIVSGAATDSAARRELTDEDVTAAVKAVIAERTRGGVFSFTDARTGDQLSLVLDDVRIVRGLPGYGWFPNVNFHDEQVSGKRYALDFWLKPDGDRLKLMDIRIHKAPQPEGGAWMSITRAPLAWWWLPTIERASAVAGVQAWQVMGDIHTHIAETKNGEAIELRDAGGAQLSLQLVDIDPPVGRSKADGRYFACALLRKFGNPPAFYSTAYWLDAKTKLVTAGSVTEVDAAREGESKAAAEPRCDVGGIAFDIVD
ncbi:MAG: hypothetical protein M5U16_07185 [Hyphomicrobium sp.]|nr:hypothetical protein [Hyphomicrobium sp.]